MRWMPLAALLFATPALADGKAIYDANCATCHGPNGAGDGPAGAALNPKPANFTDPAFWAKVSDEEIKKAIKEGGAAVGKSPLMAPWGGVLNDQQVDEVIAYIKSLKKDK